MERPRRNLENYVIPRIGGVALQELNAAHVNRLYAELLSSGRVQTDGGLSATSVRRIHAMLSKALRDAIRWGRTERNATELADPPPMKVVAASRRRSMSTWSEADLKRFLDAATPHKLHAMWVFAATTGVRRSELLDIRWADINLKAATAAVRQIVIDGPDGYRLEQDQKSVASARTLHLSHRTVDMLVRHREAQAEQREAAGPAWKDHDLVFPRADGIWWNPPAISLAFHRAAKAAGVPPVRLHDVRVRHEAPCIRVGCKDPPPGCRSSPVKLRAA